MRKKLTIFGLSLALVLGMILLSVGQQPMILPGFNLNDLIDVNVPAPSDGYVITWNAATGKWIPAASGGGAGDFTGPASSTDHAIVRFDGVGGKTGLNSGVTIDDSGNVALSAATHLILPLENDAATPTLAFGDGDTGFYESVDDTLRISISGVNRWYFEGASFYSPASNSVGMAGTTATSTSPSLNVRGDADTGIGWAGADQLSLIAGGVEGIRISEDTTILVDLKGEVNSVSSYGTMQTATGDGTTTIDWGLGNFMYFTFGAANETFTFTAPANKGRMTLVVKQDGVGSRIATWPATVKWPGGVAPTLSTTAADVDIISFFYDGTSYHGLFNGDFS